MNLNISEELFTIAILHELIHMASTDLKKLIVGYANSKLPITYNEACTQWLTLKLFYGEENLNQAINNNIFYPESVKILNKLVREIGEEVVFSGFFEADLKKQMDLMTKEQQDKWIVCILELSKTEEEQWAQINSQKFTQQVEDFKKTNN